MYQLTTTNAVLRLADGALIPDDPRNVDRVAYAAWLDEGNTPLPVPSPTFQDRQRALQAAVQQRMDAQAQALGYDDIKTAVTYAEEPAVPEFQAQGAALRAWRSLTWARCYELLAEVVAETRPEPTGAEILDLLPAWVPPEAP